MYVAGAIQNETSCLQHHTMQACQIGTLVPAILATEASVLFVPNSVQEMRCTLHAKGAVGDPPFQLHWCAPLLTP
eukprot:7447753-Lingulodinium_polyedra.AAC.1